MSISQEIRINQYDQFWSMLHSEILSFDERIQLIRTTEFDLNDESQPWCILQYFADLLERENPIDDALRVANVFKERLGLIIVESEATACCSEFHTIMDEFAYYNNIYPELSWNTILYIAFKKTGFLHAKDVHPRALFRLYFNVYQQSHEVIDKSILYEPCLYAEDLATWMYHPIKIKKWMDNNPDKEIEDYLQ